MIERRSFLIASSLLALASCASCKANDVQADDVAFDPEETTGHQARRHTCREDIVGVFLFSPGGGTVSAMREPDVEEAASLISALEPVTADYPAITPDGGVAGGQDQMFFIVLSTAETLSIGTDGKRALYDSVPYESDYDTCQELYSLYARLIGR